MRYDGNLKNKWRVFLRDDVVASFDTRKEATKFEKKVAWAGLTMVLKPMRKPTKS